VNTINYFDPCKDLTFIGHPRSKSMSSSVTHPQLLTRLKCESQIENNERTRSHSAFPGSQHYRGVEGRAGALGGD
jgi:hypothetical protein